MSWSLKIQKSIVLKPHFPYGGHLNLVNFIANKSKNNNPLIKCMTALCMFEIPVTHHSTISLRWRMQNVLPSLFSSLKMVKPKWSDQETYAEIAANGQQFYFFIRIRSFVAHTRRKGEYQGRTEPPLRGEQALYRSGGCGTTGTWHTTYTNSRTEDGTGTFWTSNHSTSQQEHAQPRPSPLRPAVAPLPRLPGVRREAEGGSERFQPALLGKCLHSSGEAVKVT